MSKRVFERTRVSRGTVMARCLALLSALLIGTSLAFLGGCGASLSTAFASIDGPKDSQPVAGLSATPAAKADPKARAAAEKLTSVATPGQGYKIGPLDVIELSVFKVPELSRTAQVAETGTVNLPLVGE